MQTACPTPACERVPSMSPARLLMGVACVLVTLVCAPGCRTMVMSADGKTSYQMEKAYWNWEVYISATIPEAHRAALGALDGLQLKPYRNRVDMISGLLKGEFADGMNYTLVLRFVAPTVTELSIRCGFWGDENRSVLLFRAIEQQLAAPANAVPGPLAPW